MKNKDPKSSLAVRLIKIWVGVSLLFLILYLGYSALNAWVIDPFFRLDKIKVIRTQSLSEKVILDIAGIEPGKNIFDYELSTISRRLSESPWIQDCKIKRVLPGTLVIEVVDRQPWGIVSDDMDYLIDSRGVLLKQYDRGGTYKLPMITGIFFQSSYRRIGHPLPSQNLKDFLDSIQDIPGAISWLKSNAKKIHLRSGLEFEIIVDNLHAPVVLSILEFSRNFGYIFATEHILAKLPGNIEFIDLRFRDRMILSCAQP